MRTPGPPHDIPPPLELEALKVLWGLGEGSVRQVRQELAAHRPLAYTTVMTVLDRLSRKGAVSRRKNGRSFVYVPMLSRDLLRGLAVNELVESLFGGSREELIEYLRGGELGDRAPATSQSPLDTALL